MISSDPWDVIILGSGVAGVAAALAAHELGLRPLVLEKASSSEAALSVPMG
jgi:succinate dehydrogenase/fumarate reductase flavoprotein subunit